MVRRGNLFLQTVAGIARSEGFDRQSIVALFRGLSSADFLFAAPSFSRHPQIPEAVWQRVCDHFHASSLSPFRRQHAPSSPMAFKEKSMVFIPGKLTERLVADNVISERIPSAQRLYQLLNWTLRISKVAACCALFEGRNGGKAMVIDTELHDEGGQSLFALCTPNDVVTAKSQEWQLAALLTAQRLRDLGIAGEALPRGVRAQSLQFERLRAILEHPQSGGLKALKRQFLSAESQRKPSRLAQIKCIETGRCRKGRKRGDNVLTVGVSAFRRAVRSALESEDERHDLVPMVSIVSRKGRKCRAEDFSVDHLLPVRVGGDWVGVVYRGGEPFMALLDIYDITNKALLCDPCFGVDGMEWFRNGANRLRIVADAEECPEPTPSLRSMESASPEPRVPEMTPTPPLTASPSLSPTPSWNSAAALPPLPALCVPAPQCLAASAPLCLSTESVLEWTSGVLGHGVQSAAYFAQFLPQREAIAV